MCCGDTREVFRTNFDKGLRGQYVRIERGPDCCRPGPVRSRVVTASEVPVMSAPSTRIQPEKVKLRFGKITVEVKNADRVAVREKDGEVVLRLAE